MAGNHHANSANCWIDPQLLKVMQNIEGALAEPYHLSVGITFRQVAGIDVSSDRSDRRDPTEYDENVRAANIASVEMICATPASACSASGRKSPWVSEMIPIFSTTQYPLDARPNGVSNYLDHA